MSPAAIVTIYAAFTAVAGVYILVVTGLNGAWMLRTNLIRPQRSGPLVSVLIPARDEEAHIAACLDSLLLQTYDNYEIIVYDDDSSDGTARILARYAAEHSERLKIISGHLEAGWYGKPHAMQRLSENASGTWLYFTDADTLHGKDSVSKLVGLAEHYKADFVSGYIRHRIGSFGEAMVVPAIYLLSMVAMPLWLIHALKAPIISHAIGQAMFFRTSTYAAAGGYEAVKHQVSEDVRIARLVKKHGGRAVFADLKEEVSCRMYEDYGSAIAGFSKNVYDYFNKNNLVLAAATVAVPLVFFIPIIGSIWLPAALVAAQPFFRLSCLALLYAWGFVALERMLPWYIPFAYPVILINVLSTAWRAYRLFKDGKAIEWKGRMVK